MISVVGLDGCYMTGALIVLTFRRAVADTDTAVMASCHCYLSGRGARVTLVEIDSIRREDQGAFVPSRPKSSERRTTSSSSGVDTSMSVQRSIAV
jgi:hypothetical protein